MYSFDEGTQILETIVGDGPLTMGIVVQQPYAAAEHNRTYYRHPRGGMAYYLEIPLITAREQYLMQLAMNAITKDGSDLIKTAIEIAENMTSIVRRNAPVQSGLLRESTDAFVRDAGITIYFREQLGPYNKDKDG